MQTFSGNDIFAAGLIAVSFQLVTSGRATMTPVVTVD